MPEKISTLTMKIVVRSLVAFAMAGIFVAASGDDIMRAVCAGLGSDHPLYDILGCPAIEHPPSPEG